MASAAAAKKCPRLFHAALALLHQPQVSLMHQRRRLQRLPRLLLGQLRGRQLPQFVIDQRQVASLPPAGSPCSICDKMRVTSDISTRIASDP